MAGLATPLAKPMARRITMALTLPEGVGGWDSSALIDADFGTSRWYRFNGHSYPNETAWLAAIGGSKSGITRTIGPYAFGDELFSDPTFASGVDSWDDAPTYTANGDVSQVGGRLRMTYTGAGTAYRARRQTTVTPNRAYNFQLTIAARTDSDPSFVTVTAAANTDLNNGAETSFNLGAAFPQTISRVFGAQFNPSYFGSRITGGGALNNYVEFEDASLKECYPYQGYLTQQIGARLNFTTPAAASGNKVLAEWSDDNSSRLSRVRVVFDATSHLRVIVTSDNSEQANLDLGAVSTSTAYTLALAATGNRFSASLDGAAIVTDTVGTMPGVGKLWIGRSVSGETWDGTIDRVRIYAEALSDAALTDPFESFYAFGDSTAAASGATGSDRWFAVLGAAYTPDRTALSAGVGGEDTTQMLARVEADTEHRDWTTIFMDRPNTGETSTDWLANMKAAAAFIPHGRWLVVPPVLNSPSGQPDTSWTAIGEIQAALLSDTFFAGHTFDASEQAAYIAEMNDDATRVGTGDWTHFNTAGQALQAARIKTTLDLLGW